MEWRSFCFDNFTFIDLAQYADAQKLLYNLGIRLRSPRHRPRRKFQQYRYVTVGNSIEDKMSRNITQHTIAFFWDLRQRGILNLDPSYQRRSVWNEEYKSFFIDTVISNYPCPPVFLHQEISPDGQIQFNVVDGKQRLMAIFEFIDGAFTVPEKAEKTHLRGRYFKDLPDDVKVSFWGYILSAEYLPDTSDRTINNIFDRINRNVARLTRQELRHAKFGGAFIKAAEELAVSMAEALPNNFRVVNIRSASQMRDVEFVSQLLLYLEEGVASYSQDELDVAYNDREQEWAFESEARVRFSRAIREISDILKAGETRLIRSRLKNQADFYSLFAAIDTLLEADELPDAEEAYGRLEAFVDQVESDTSRAHNGKAMEYFNAARSASNDVGPRNKRIDIIIEILTAG